MKRERNLFQPATVETLHPEDLLSERVTPARIVIRHLAIGHEPDELRSRHIPDIARRNVTPIAKNRDPMTDTEDLVHPV